MNEKSALYGWLDSGKDKPSTEYYGKVQEYINMHLSESIDKRVMKDMQWQVENEKGIF